MRQVSLSVKIMVFVYVWYSCMKFFSNSIRQTHWTRHFSEFSWHAVILRQSFRWFEVERLSPSTKQSNTKHSSQSFGTLQPHRQEVDDVIRDPSIKMKIRYDVTHIDTTNEQKLMTLSYKNYVLKNMVRTHPPCWAIHVAASLSTTNPIASMRPNKYSGWPWWTQSTAKPPATQYNEIIFPQVISVLRSSCAIELNTPRIDFSLVIVTAT